MFVYMRFRMCTIYIIWLRRVVVTRYNNTIYFNRVQGDRNNILFYKNIKYSLYTENNIKFMKFWITPCIIVIIIHLFVFYFVTTTAGSINDRIVVSRRYAVAATSLRTTQSGFVCPRRRTTIIQNI